MPTRDDADSGQPVKVTVVDRRHHAQHDAEAAGPVRRPYPSFVQELEARTERAERKAREAIERAQAEVDAVRERLQRDVDRRVREGRSGLLGRLLDVLDNMDRAADAASGESEAVRKGIDLIRQQLLSVMKQEGVEPIETIGRPYDPTVAEAVAVEAVEADRHDLVLQQFQRGYRFGESVLRPAKVKVGRAGGGTEG